ncbi:MAG: dihydroxyacetone kinase subunit DhaL [Pseudotabrizicola sp.]|uniref:dihydroxyacetone kinase subunit DhaL n=1 Tax=Pseudotabrizicola sp. TaxID=2939647 RepID=UPI0027315D22|nr:dihydroxyacetone kinase subunit DhaL [Pseudotabrizicola sp.]MDP2079608.1 dihydroxyacetone kinase subunit DhaL [Pseudotabrizicola sp.]MDZ7576377.1 dihydroxyacetone kinase subunit DhaL [Pseudotabrizicola sp.]
MEDFSSRKLIDLFRLIAVRMSDARRELGALDGAIGDADHGNSMAEGFAAIVRAIAADDDRPPAEVMLLAGQSFLSAVGATTGPLYASAMLAAANGLDGKTTVSAADVAGLVPAFADGIAKRGHARPGDKTMMDAWAPAARAVLEAEKAGLAPIVRLSRARAAAIAGRDDTRAMMAAVGRAASLGPRSLGHIDPGAASAVIIIAALHEWLHAQRPPVPEKAQ